MEALVLPAATLTLTDRPDVLAILLADKRSPQTRRAYAADLRDFFGTVDPEAVREFLALPVPGIALRLHQYKARLIEAGLSEATVNRRLAAVRSLLGTAHKVGLSQTDGAGLVQGEKTRAYRDTRGIGLPTLKRLVKAPGTDTLRGLRDTAILKLLTENALRRAEVCALKVKDLDAGERRLMILGKGHGTQREPVTLSQQATAALLAYLHQSGHATDREAPLFVNADHRPGHRGQALTGDGLYYLVGFYGRAVGIEGLTPHKLRHSSITALLDGNGGDVRMAQRLSRHAKLETLQRYDDNRSDLQGQASSLLAKMMEG